MANWLTRVSTDIFICGLTKSPNMHDSESDTIHLVNKHEAYCESLKKIGITAEVKQIDTNEMEKEDYYSKNFTNSPAMTTNLGTIILKGSNIDEVEIIQRG